MKNLAIIYFCIAFMNIDSDFFCMWLSLGIIFFIMG